MKYLGWMIIGLMVGCDLPASSDGGDGGSGSYGNSCVPQCTGKQCGSDGCGGQCGSCNGAYACVANQCVAKDANSCAGRCGAFVDNSTCQCDDGCVEAGDCCSDRATICTGNNNNPGCGDVPENGICGNGFVRYCQAATDKDVPSVVTVQCKAKEACTVGSDGWASCTPIAGACAPGVQGCQDSQTAQICGADGSWTSSPCSNCQATPAGVVCGQGAVTSGNKVHLAYEYRTNTDAMTGWGAIYTAALPGALVLATQDDGSGTPKVLAAAHSDDAGDVDLGLSTGQLANVTLVLMAAHAQDNSASSFDIIALKPELGDGEQTTDAVYDANATPWAWSVPAQQVMGNTWTITEGQNSGVLRVFDYARFMHAQTLNIYGSKGLQQAIWMRPNTSWSCGACFNTHPTTTGSISVQSNMWIPMLSADTSYWSDAVNAHELGHWLMASYGKTPGEGGTHFLACPTFPGQAWSEGWATWVSSAARGSSVYFDSQDGTFFWVDIGTLKTSHGSTLPSPNSGDGVLQQMSENAVSGLLWHLTAQDTVAPPMLVSANDVMFKAISTAGMTTTPYGRGYTRHTWSVGDGSNCDKTDVTNTGKSAPMLADFLDALLCSGVSASSVQSGLGSFPFPVQSPICK